MNIKKYAKPLIFSALLLFSFGALAQSSNPCNLSKLQIPSSVQLKPLSGTDNLGWILDGPIKIDGKQVKASSFTFYHTNGKPSLEKVQSFLKTLKNSAYNKSTNSCNYKSTPPKGKFELLGGDVFFHSK